MSRLRFRLVPLLIATWSVSAGAATWTVLPDGTGDAPTIRAAVDSAAAGDTLSLGCGTFLESDIHLKPDLVVLGNGCATIDAQGLDRHFVAYRLPGEVELNGLRLENGQAAGNGGTEGGSIQATLSNVRVTDCVFSGCTASDGAAVLADSATAAFTGCEFTDCSTTVLRRAIVRLRDADGMFDNCWLHANIVSASLTDGGVIRATGGPVTMTGTVCEDHAAPAVRCDSGVTATSCQFLGNGGVFGAPVQMTDCTMEGDPRGVESGADLTLTDCTFVGIPLTAAIAAGPASIQGCTLIDVKTDLNGGGLVTSTVFRVGDPLSSGSPSVDLGSATVEQCSLFHVSVTFTGVLRNCVLAWCGAGGSLTSLAECTDIWRPDTDAWTGTLQWLAPLYGNMEADPLICDYRNGVYGVATGSPCLPGNNSCGVTIGARTQECATTDVEPMTWSRVKAAYR